MRTRTRTVRAGASIAALAAVLTLGAVPAQADGASATNVIRKPQLTMVLADGDTGGKRPV
ncbi:hypothetical protein [Nonomuraea gerenzanensis]|uniref:Uncharacterized protein n=1 Tax=Nonomuraea gerenzanensis TaxID=93944 RepID=A0A1M4EHK1_9ACTN|nr:hypothetical protein [Nonomuraea gerenzanensis]UBU09978.1 hypothetical protein LCN96_37255 [Nonomuraea gerenzanensis]SBO98431.1 hypothetical protein BN4615_P7947 [Nonomuraea gerenzanensis]